MINDLTDEIFWVLTVGLCILFIIRLLSPPPGDPARTDDLTKLSPRRRIRRRTFRGRWHARRKARAAD